MAQDWTRHAARFLSDASPKEFAVAFGAELSDIAAGYPSRLVASVVSDTFEMHRRHGEAVRRVVEMEIRSAASAIVQEVIPSDSLMAALLTSALNRRPAPVGLDDETEVEAPLSDGDDSIFPLRLVFGPFLRIRGLGEFAGAHLVLVGDLKPYLEADLQAQADEHRWIPSGHLGVKNTVRQHAKRCRDEFAAQYAAVEAPILIQSRKPRGFRLDPEARFLGPG
jgi:hypothetical protein